MPPISLILRCLFYIFLFVISLCGLFFAAFSGGREYEMNYLVICTLLIPQLIFGLIFLQTNMIIRLIVSLVTTFISAGYFWLMIWLMRQTKLFEIFNSELLFTFILFLPVIFIWEIAYQILIKYLNQNKESNDIE